MVTSGQANIHLCNVCQDHDHMTSLPYECCVFTMIDSMASSESMNSLDHEYVEDCKGGDKNSEYEVWGVKSEEC